MSPLRAIRRHRLKLTQVEMARALGVQQSCISQWESGRRTLGLPQQRKIRELAQKMGVRWNDRWFFEAA